MCIYERQTFNQYKPMWRAELSNFPEIAEEAALFSTCAVMSLHTFVFLLCSSHHCAVCAAEFISLLADICDLFCFTADQYVFFRQYLSFCLPQTRKAWSERVYQ